MTSVCHRMEAHGGGVIQGADCAGIRQSSEAERTWALALGTPGFKSCLRCWQEVGTLAGHLTALNFDSSTGKCR